LEEGEGEVGELGLKGRDLGLELRDLLTQVGQFGSRGSGRGIRGAKRSKIIGIGETAIMQASELSQLLGGQTFDASIAGMQARSELRGFEPTT